MMKTKHISTVILLGLVLALGTCMYSCGSDDDNELDTPPLEYLTGRGGYFVGNIHAVDIKGCVYVEPLYKSNTVQAMYIEDTQSKDRYYFNYQTEEYQDYLFSTFAELSEDGEYTTKGINVSFSGQVAMVLEKYIADEDWLELTAQGINIYFFNAETESDNLRIVD